VGVEHEWVKRWVGVSWNWVGDCLLLLLAKTNYRLSGLVRRIMMATGSTVRFPLFSTRSKEPKPSTPDLAGPDIVKFGIESKHSCHETSTKQFKEAIVDAMQDVRIICEHAQVETGEVNSKL
jgi:hypothetical protein